jgi:hypothetical protein
LGLSDFLVRRTKQELHIAFFKEFQDKIKTSEEMQILFPKTATVLGTLDRDVYQFSAFWEAIRMGFAEDLDKILPNLSVYAAETDKIKDKGIKAISSDMFMLMELLKTDAKPTDVIRYLGNEGMLQQLELDKKGMRVVQANLRLIGLLSEALESDSKTAYWIKSSDMLSLSNDTLNTDFFLGLLYQRGKNIEMGDNYSFGDYLKTLRKTRNNSKTFIRELQSFVVQGQKLELYVKEMKEKEKASRDASATVAPISKADKAKQFYNYAEQCIDMVEWGYTYKKRFMGAASKEDSLFKHYLGIAKNLNQLTYEVQEQKYAIAIVTTINIIEKILPDDVWGCEQRNLLKYGSFIATAVNAKDAEQVSQAIEAFALPPGSSAIKKYAGFSVSLNAYVGASGGMEFLEGLSPSPFYSLATPIGISINRGFRKAGSLSLLISVLDIGALTTYRFDPNNTSALPDLRFENVLAPGGYLVYGVPRYPLSFGIGGQLGPNLRSVTNGNLNITSTKGFRLGAFIAVDIPLVNLYSSNKQYRACN